MMKIFKPIALFTIVLCFVCICSCSDDRPKESPKKEPEQYELKVNPNDKYLGITMDHGVGDVINYADSNGTRYHYSYFTTTITNDTILPIQMKIGFPEENYSRTSDKQKFKVFILPEGLEPEDELKKLLETPLGTTITLNKADGGNISEELRKLLEAQIPFTLTKIIEPKEKCTITIGIIIDINYNPVMQTALVTKGHKYPFLMKEYPNSVHEWDIDKAISTKDPLALFLGVDFFRWASADQRGNYSLIPCGKISFFNK